jgi:capsular polysaccharide biosynthesis protein
VTFLSPQGNDPPESSWTGDITADEEARTVDSAAAFTSLGFIRASLRRGAALWCATAVIGLLIGYGLYVKYPPAYQATTSVLLTNDPAQDAAAQIQTDIAIAESQVVAGRVVQQLGLHQSVGSLIAAYSVTQVTPQVLLFTVNAPSPTDVVRRASALATAFLQYRAQMLESRQQLEAAAFDQQINQAQQALNSINRKISQVPAQSASAAGQATFRKLQAQLANATETLTAIQADKSTTLSRTQITTAAMVHDSGVLNAATAMRHSIKNGKAYYLFVALVGGLSLGMGIVIIRALVSDRLRRRDDVADAIGAPIGLSVGPVGGRRWLPGAGRGATRRAHDMRRVVTHLNAAVPQGSRRPAGLAVVAVENAEIVARAVVSLAVSWASQGKDVVIADFSSGTDAAHLLGVKRPGIHAASADGANFAVAVPDPDDTAPVGPLPSGTFPVLTGTPQAEAAQSSPGLAAACASADLVLTLATLDPASGADHLATWATDVVVIVTAGRSSATSIHSVGEMIRLAGTRLVSVVLTGVDKSDDTLGVMNPSDLSAPVMSI